MPCSYKQPHSLPLLFQIPYTPLLHYTNATCHSRLIVLGLITRLINGEENESYISSLFCILQSPVTSSLLGPSIFFKTLLPNTLNLSSSVSVREPTPNNSGREIRVFIYIYIYIYIYINLYTMVCLAVEKAKLLQWMKAGICWVQPALLSFSNVIMIC